MERIHQRIWSFKPNSPAMAKLSVSDVRRSEGHSVATYSQLVTRLAQLAFANPDFVLLFRGQHREYLEDDEATLFPTMFRTLNNSIYGHELAVRYEQLRAVEQRLYRIFNDDYASCYRERIGRSELARWAILQHYDVCPTPLLDVTHSALIATSFALDDEAEPSHSDRILYVLGLPQISGAVTVSPSQGIQIVRLSSVCPPETLRPYIQEGYLIGTYPSVSTIDEKMRYDRDEMDCARRLIAKFRISVHHDFWDNGFQPLTRSTVCPEETNGLVNNIKQLKGGVARA